MTIKATRRNIATDVQKFSSPSTLGDSARAGEIGINENAGYALQFNKNGTVVTLLDSDAVAGADTQVLFNNAGAFAGSANLTWVPASNALVLPSTANAFVLNQTLAALQSGGMGGAVFAEPSTFLVGSGTFAYTAADNSYYPPWQFSDTFTQPSADEALEINATLAPTSITSGAIYRSNVLAVRATWGGDGVAPTDAFAAVTVASTSFPHNATLPIGVGLQITPFWVSGVDGGTVTSVETLRLLTGGGDNNTGSLLGHYIVIAADDIASENAATKQFINYGSGKFIVDSAGAITAAGLLVSNGAAIKTDTTTAHTALLQAYDVDGTAYKTFGALTNGNTPDFTIAPPSGGTVTLQATTFKSNDGSTGATAGPFTVITSITVKNGLVTALTGS